MPWPLIHPEEDRDDSQCPKRAEDGNDDHHQVEKVPTYEHHSWRRQIEPDEIVRREQHPDHQSADTEDADDASGQVGVENRPCVGREKHDREADQRPLGAVFVLPHSHRRSLGRDGLRKSWNG